MLLLNAKKVAPRWWKQEALNVQFSAGRGRGVYARRKILRGEVFLEEDAVGISSDENFTANLVKDPRVYSLYPICSHRSRVPTKMTDGERGEDGKNGKEDKEDCEDIARLSSILDYNCFDGPKNSIMLFLHISLLNHSCEPNTDIICTNSPLAGKKRMKIFATKDIEAGEEVFISYIENVETLEKRERGLQLRPWFAFCACSRCVRTAKLSRHIQHTGHPVRSGRVTQESS